MNISLPLPFCRCYRPVRQGFKRAAFYYKQGVMPSLFRPLPDGFRQGNPVDKITVFQPEIRGLLAFVNWAIVWLGALRQYFRVLLF
jgi:hypothetical protein